MKKISQHLRPFVAAVGLIASASFATPAVNLTIGADHPGPVINKNIYGQFAEHLGHGIYEGIWVGEKSKIPNIKGFRKDVVGALKDLHVPLIRWPGGCFADEYHWRDGIGQRTKRPIKVNTNWGGVAEDNAFGTHEFFELSEMLGSETYVNGNLGTGTPQEMAEWLEYMTSDGTSSLAQLRRKNGRDKPWKVDYFAIGNEAWGCGGNMRPEYYTDLYNRYASFLKAPKDNTPKFIASGGNDTDTIWSDYLTANIKPNWSLKFDAVSFHYYTLPTGEWKKKGEALGFPEKEWISTFANTLKIDKFITDNTAVMDKNDPEKKIGFYVDEWGTWYDAQEGSTPGFLRQQNSLRDALVAAINFNIFHRHAERVHMTNIAQMVNVLQAMILTDKEKMVLTPTYYAYQLYIPFQDATFLPVDLADVPQYTLGDVSVPAVSASAARDKDGKIHLALVNIDPHNTVTFSVNLDGAKAQKASGHLLTADAMDAHNNFDAPNAIKPVAYSANVKNGKLSLTLPAKSVVVVELQ